ncbi:hypothetical protein [Streptomyces sp. URMC 123]|uniref:hypothetical protein n=1 Tax=Streptomyces sp. URMC 123 TaxID=3423403 RepID=UPI003F1A5897
MGYGEFEGKKLEELYAMVSDAKPDDLANAGKALSDAGLAITGIGDDLRRYVDRVEWRGEAASSFRKWGHDMALETLRMGVYTTKVGSEMATAATALASAKAAVPKPDGMCYADAEKEKKRIEEAEPKRQEAVMQLVRLSSFYEASRLNIMSQQPPMFPPPPESGPGFGNAGSQTSIGGGAGVGAAAVTNRTAPGVGAARIDGVAGASERRLPDTVAADRSTGTSIDSTTVAPAPLPDTSLRPASTAPIHVSPAPPAQMVVPPPSVPVTPITGPVANGGGGAKSLRGVGGDSKGGRSGGGRASRVAFPAGADVPRMGGGEGIVGGKPAPVSGSSKAPRLPQGMVIGEERAGMTRGPMGAGGYPGGAVGGGMPGQGAAGAGRRLTTQPGGAVGGARSSMQSRSEFTPGGSGLVRGQAGAMGPVGAAGSAQQKRRGDGRTQERPDYLVEDEETWTAGRRNVVPPVVD